MSISIQFLGAAHTVTGSCYLVEAGNTKFLVDCGMYQGPDVEARNLLPFDFNPSEIDFVLLTHTHIDHSGLLPKLTRHGFNGPIYATFHTTQLVPILLLDSAKIQENNFKEGVPWKYAGVVEMAYNMHDAEKTIAMLNAVDFDEEFEPTGGMKVKYVKAAHVLGAASIEIEFEGKRIVFSGDIGRINHELIGGFDLNYKAEPDYIVMESLYGGQHHPKRQEAVSKLITIIRETINRGGSVFIPCFAVQRTQEMLNDIKLAKQAGALSEDVAVWLDSPMAQNVTNIYRAALDYTEESNFDFPGLRYVKGFRQSQNMSRKPGQIVIAGSGMADGGRILSHLAGNLGNSKNAVCFVGYQAEATMGRKLTEGAKVVSIDGVTVNVHAQIHLLQGFSAHGDTNDYQAWVDRYRSDRLKQIFLVHAEVERAEALRQQFIQNNVVQDPQIPEWKAKVELI